LISPITGARVIDSGLVGSTQREQKMLKGHLPRVICHQVYEYTKINGSGFGVRAPQLSAAWGRNYYRGTSLIRTPPPVGPYSSPMPRDLW